jgi:hypothetical protein
LSLEIIPHVFSIHRLDQFTISFENLNLDFMQLSLNRYNRSIQLYCFNSPISIWELEVRMLNDRSGLEMCCSEFYFSFFDVYIDIVDAILLPSFRISVEEHNLSMLWADVQFWWNFERDKGWPGCGFCFFSSFFFLFRFIGRNDLFKWIG